MNFAGKERGEVVSGQPRQVGIESFHEPFPRIPVRKIEFQGFPEVFLQDHSVNPWSGTWKDDNAHAGRTRIEQRMARGMEPRPAALITYGSNGIAWAGALEEIDYPYPVQAVVPHTLKEKQPEVHEALSKRCDVHDTDLTKGYLTGDDILDVVEESRREKGLARLPRGLAVGTWDFYPLSPIYRFRCDEILEHVWKDDDKEEFLIMPFGTGDHFSAMLRRVMDWTRARPRRPKPVHIVGVGQNNVDSIADKLPSLYSAPAMAEIPAYMEALKQRKMFGDTTGIYSDIPDTFFVDATEELRAKGLKVEPSAAAPGAFIKKYADSIPKDARIGFISSGELSAS